MKFFVDNEHREFFQKRRWIEFDDLISKEKLGQLQAEISTTLSERLKCTSEDMAEHSSSDCFLAGHDLWRDNPQIFKIISHRRFGEIASELTGDQPIRLGIDQYFPAPHQGILKESDPYAEYLSQTASMHEISCIQGISSLLLICLSSHREKREEEEHVIFPVKPGNGIFCTPHKLLDFSPLLKDLGDYYLVIYAKANSQFILNRRDPFYQKMISLGYSFGDRLKDSLNPVIYR